MLKTLQHPLVQPLRSVTRLRFGPEPTIMELTPTPKTRQKNKSNRVLELIGGVGADALQYGDKKIGERSTQIDPTLVQTSNSKNVPQFFQAQPRKNIASRSLGDLYLVMKDLFGFNVTQYFKAIFLERS